MQSLPYGYVQYSNKDVNIKFCCHGPNVIYAFCGTQRWVLVHFIFCGGLNVGLHFIFCSGPDIRFLIQCIYFYVVDPTLLFIYTALHSAFQYFNTDGFKKLSFYCIQHFKA